MLRFFQWILLATIAIVTCCSSSISFTAIVTFLPLVALVVLLIAEKRLSLLALFIAAFAYMIPVEAVFGEDDLVVKWGQECVLQGYRVLMLSFISVCAGFLLFRKPLLKQDLLFVAKRNDLGNLRYAKFFFILCTIFSVVIFSPTIVSGFTVGRGGGTLFNVGVFGYFLLALLYTICAFWGYYYKKENNGGISIIKVILFSSPIFLIGIASGTRYILTFMLLCTFAPWIYQLSAKKIKWIAIGAVIVMSVFSTMKATRYGGFDVSAMFKSERAGENIGNGNILTNKLISKGSSEGLIRNMAMIAHHTSVYSNTYGKSIGFLFIFYIPRFIWEDKPTQLDYWLIREYETGFSDGYSTASSFCGELYMDFGYFCIIVSFFLGLMIAKLDRYVEEKIVNGTFFQFAVSALLLGWTFFMTRSILTASYSLMLGAVLVFFVSRFILKEKPFKREF